MREDNIEILTKWIVGSLVLFTFLEAFFFPQAENLYGCTTFIIAWVVLYYCVLHLKGIERNKCLFPYLSLLGLGISFFWLPLIATFIEGKPLTFRFAVPFQTFTLQLINLLMLIAAYRLCLLIYHKNNFLQKIWLKMGYYTPPTDMQLWMLGAVGLVSTVLTLFIQGTETASVENLGFTGHLLKVTKTFIAFPFLLLFKNLYGRTQDLNYKFFLILYFILVALLGIATGKRAPVLLPVATMVACYILPAIAKNKKLMTVRTLFISLIGLYLITGPIADLAVAMSLGRDNTHRTSASKTFERILDIYKDKEKMHGLYQYAISKSDNKGDNLSGWSEYYVDNILFDRLCNIRVCDATIDYANKLGYDSNRMHSYVENRILYLIPSPILKQLGINVNKFAGQYTPGDLMSTEGLALRHQYYGYRVAGDVGIGLYLWGYLYYVYAFFIYVIFFYFISTKVMLVGKEMIIAVPALVDFFRTFLIFNNDTGIVGVLSTLLRTGWQYILVYCIVFSIVRRIVR